METEDKAGQYSRGLHAFRTGDYTTAVEYLSEAVEYDENNHRAWNALGTACAKVKRYTDADLCFENALTLDPDNQVYRKNRNTNAKHLKNPPPKMRVASGSLLDRLPLDRIPFDLIPVDKKYVIAGAAGLLVLIIIAILILTGVLFPTAPAGPPILLTANLSGSTLVLANEGGPDIRKVSSFSWTVNKIDIGTGTPGDPGTLGIEPGSTARVPLADLAGLNLSEGMRVMVIATFTDGNSQVVLDTLLPPPPADLIPAIPEITPNATPTLPPDVPRFSKDEVLVDTSTNSWWLVVIPPENGTYSLASAYRLPDGSFTSNDTSVVNRTLKEVEQTARSVGYRNAGGTPAGLTFPLPPPVTAIPTLHPEPVYVEGDLISSSPSPGNTIIAVMGYDPKTDQYKVDTLNKYYTGEWGYRDDDVPEWYFRPTLEQQNPHRINRITLSDMGVGADSAPPRTKPKYVTGDVVSPDTAALDNLAIIVTYHPDTDSYETDMIRPATTGGWIRTGKTVQERRAFVERDHPVFVRNIDLNRVQIQ